MYLERGQVRAHAAYRQAIDSVRAGTIFAYDARAWQRYLSAAQLRQRQLQGNARPLSTADLEQVLLGMARTNPDIVAIRHAPAQVH